jgi:CRISPR-associated endoribonuclease Cas6
MFASTFSRLFCLFTKSAVYLKFIYRSISHSLWARADTFCGVCHLHASANTGTNRMPQSLVLNLITQSPISRQHLQGYFLQQLFFSLVNTVDPTLGNVLRRDTQNRSYSLSALQLLDSMSNQASQGGNPLVEQAVQQTAQQMPPASVGPSTVRKFAFHRKPKCVGQTTQLQYSNRQAVPANTACWWRISFLDDDLFDHLVFLWNQLRDDSFSLGTGSVMISSISADVPGLEWASSCSYRELYEQASERDRDIHLQFVTPTAFEKEGQLTPLPTADAVFHTLRRRWNRHSGLVFAPSLISNIVATHFDIQTEITQRSRRKVSESIVGCTGQISFRIAGDDDPLIVKRINTLADFTRYCGIGCNTQLGMGVIRRINRPGPDSSGLAIF